MNYNADSFIYQQLRLISLTGSNIIVLGLLILVPTLYLFYKKYWVEVLMVFLSILSFPYNQLLKGLFQTDRPAGADPAIYTPFDVYGFPSGHVVFYTSFFGYILYLTLKLKKVDKLLKKFVAWACIYFILFISVSRVGLGMHSVGDVLGGYLFGGIFLFGLIYLDKKLSGRLESTKERKEHQRDPKK